MSTPITQKQADDIANRLFAAISSHDVDAIRQVYAPDATIWNNHSPATVGVDELVTMLGQMRGAVDTMWFERVRTQATPMGFVDQHVTHFTTKRGASVALASCMVVGLRDGRIASVEEYSNPADMAPLVAELMDSSSGAQ